MGVVGRDVGVLATFGLGSLRGGLGQSRRCREGGVNKRNKRDSAVLL